ncbi:beta-1,4-glucuronyltransferase 1-like [Odontomachus brunneus]|uniref:beta-1,4-glucuronyltransferase 1-like n=1 Tax=Odontomachus brunneus TaxID=486640 RepID=UPI0013F20CB3|nr:beta-1,4-glucuronyltransferase 1-like [Odontomachus brunneus]XP_032683458.1 beta-1,4-glucuronyltransferase 1-like [Odontomachus brunneus]XP_032683459.1 beta-1,4-glucuronyltransferase 1-like [Odontomachus brunneus]XP_032683460.1 beta-1,4-glucuronyltransferase 1-like [Odontomachus brunneus]
MRSLARRLLVWSALVLSLLVVGRLLFGYDFRQSSGLVLRDEGISIPDSHANPQQDAQPGPPVYSAGMYMAGRRPHNTSVCRWYYGLPEVLSYPPSRLTWSPEIGEKSPYRILPFVLRGAETTDRLPQVTLSTHATADQVYGIVELARRWEGPLSLSVFVPGLDAGLAVAQLDRACRCEPAMYKVSVHLVFPAGRPPAVGVISRTQGDCAASDLQWRQAETERRKRSMTYPINVARNVARTAANTSRVLVSDIELLPSARLASGFVEMVRHRPPRIGMIFVVPVFEIESNEQPPATKLELLAACRAGLAVYFHRFLCPHCQRFPGLTRWMIRPDPGKVRPLIITRREYPHHRWEPVFIGTREDPLYTEEMSWEGKQDKMAQMFEMCLLNYRLVVLDGAFLVHTPGIKRKTRKISVATQEFFRPHERRNARIYQRVIKRLIKQYPINRRCAQ